MQKVDTVNFLAELAALEAAFDRPLLMKAHIINWILPFIARTIKKVLFIHITRDPLYTAQSLLESRRKYFGTIDTWYSFKPPEFEALKLCSPWAQVAGQVYFTNDAISRGLQAIDQKLWMRVRYEDFCANPTEVFSAIQEKFSQQAETLDCNYKGPERFDCGNRLRIGPEEKEEIMKAYADFSRDVGPTW